MIDNSSQNFTLRKLRQGLTCSGRQRGSGGAGTRQTAPNAGRCVADENLQD